MAICTFFGHRDCPSSVYPSIKTCIENLIQTEKADSFYVGENGRFDALVLKAPEELKRQYPMIQFSLVLSSMPSDKQSTHHIETILPDCVENAARRFAVDRRNRWMLKTRGVEPLSVFDGGFPPIHLQKP